MAEPTQAQKIAAMRTALAGLGVTDADEAARAVAAFWSQAPLLPVAQAPAPPPVPPPAPSDAPVLVTSLINSDDPALKARIKALGDEATAIMKAIMAAPE